MIEFDRINELNVYKFSTSSIQQKYLLNYRQKYFEIGASLAELVDILKQSDNLKDAIGHYIRIKDGVYSYEQVEDLIRKYICPIYNTNHSKESKTFLFSKELFSDKDLDKYSDLFRFLFNKSVRVAIGLMALVCEFVFFLTCFRGDFSFHIQTPFFLGILFFLIISSFIHELGHASACKYYHINHGGIGFGLYFNFPVFYTDVSAIWRLKRSQRCVVNMAGVYFQVILLLPLLITYFFTYEDFVKYIIIVMNINFVITLNPFFKFDGYWLVTDLLGVPNLRTRSNEVLKYYYMKMRGKPNDKKPFLLSMGRYEKILLLIYFVLVNAFFCYYFFCVIPYFLMDFFESFPADLDNLFFAILNGISPDYEILKSVFSKFIFFLLIVYFLFRIISSLLRKIVLCHERKG